MNNQGIMATNTATRQPLLSTKGAAAPSPARLMAQGQSHQPIRHVPSPQIESMSVNSLAGLIKRASPPTTQAAQPILPTSFNTPGEAKTKPTPAPREAIAPIVRRQLTVRIHMAQFQKLDRLAQATNQSYQEIQTRALEVYLRAKDNA